jgi:hypothetical protein
MLSKPGCLSDAGRVRRSRTEHWRWTFRQCVYMRLWSLIFHLVLLPTRPNRLLLIPAVLVGGRNQDVTTWPLALFALRSVGHNA